LKVSLKKKKKKVQGPYQNVGCNIPLVSIGILLVKCIRAQIFMEIKYDGDCFIR